MIPISHMERLLAAAQNTQTWVIENCDQNTLPRAYSGRKVQLPCHRLLHPTGGIAQKVIQFFACKSKVKPGLLRGKTI